MLVRFRDRSWFGLDLLGCVLNRDKTECYNWFPQLKNKVKTQYM